MCLVLQQQDPNQISLIENIHNIVSKQLNITEINIKIGIAKLKQSKSQGLITFILSLLTKVRANYMNSEVHVYIYNICQFVKTVWKQEIITVFLNVQRKTGPDNNRSISLTSVACKLMERLIRANFFKHKIKNHFSSSFQRALILGKFRVTQLLWITDEIKMQLCKCLMVCCLTFAKRLKNSTSTPNGNTLGLLYRRYNHTFF